MNKGNTAEMPEIHLTSPRAYHPVEQITSQRVSWIRLAAASAVCRVVSRCEFWLLRAAMSPGYRQSDWSAPAGAAPARRVTAPVLLQQHKARRCLIPLGDRASRASGLNQLRCLSITNLKRPATRISKFYNGRGTAEQWRGKERVTLDAAVLPLLPPQHRVAPALRSRL
jgi:hypothetical protein